MLALVLPSFARFYIAMKLGIAIAARMPMITTTIISSISVKPFSALRMTVTPLAEILSAAPADGLSAGTKCNRCAGPARKNHAASPTLAAPGPLREGVMKRNLQLACAWHAPDPPGPAGHSIP